MTEPRDYERAAWPEARAAGPRLAAMQEVMGKLPVRRILDCCERILTVEDRALAADGPVERTSRVMPTSALEYCLQVLWACREAALGGRKG